MSEIEKGSKAAKEFSKRGAPKGGRARASVLTAEERSDVARRAAQARWAKAGKAPAPKQNGGGGGDRDGDPPTEIVDPPGMPYSQFRGTLEIGDLSLECHVLDDQRRVLTQREVVRAISGGRDSSNLTRYLARNPLYDPDFLNGRIIEFSVPGRQQAAHGYDAMLLIDICDMYLDADEKGLLKRSQQKLVKSVQAIVRACAKVGLIALIDEATGYQKIREKRALQIKLQAFIAEEMQEWVTTFPEEFWLELARLEGIRYSPRNRPLRWGKYVMRFVYDAIDPDLGKRLREINPDPRHRKNHHQWLKENGRDKLHRQLGGVIAIMKECDDMNEFRRRFEKVFRKGSSQLTFDDLDLLA